MTTREHQAIGFPYEEFMEREGIPVHKALAGVEDVAALPREPWKRLGGKGTFIEMRSTFQSERGIYVVEIPGGEALNPEKHLYEEQIYVLQGRGAAEVWQGNGPKIAFEWNQGSVFAFPRNMSHRLMNGGNEPVILMAVTTAPELINTFDADEVGFVFNSDHKFADLYEDLGGAAYFASTDTRQIEGIRYKGVYWYTNFIADARTALVDPKDAKVAGGSLTGYRMGKRFPHGHISEWPGGRYHKAHYHGPGAILVGLSGEGFVLIWPRNLGAHPFESGHGDEVLKVNWGPRSIYSPPDGWFHQHFGTGKEPARHIAVYGAKTPMGVHNMVQSGDFMGGISFRDGGTLIEYEDEDPAIREIFAQTVKEQGVEMQMPPVEYRRDPAAVVPI